MDPEALVIVECLMWNLRYSSVAHVDMRRSASSIRGGCAPV